MVKVSTRSYRNSSNCNDIASKLGNRSVGQRPMKIKDKVKCVLMKFPYKIIADFKYFLYFMDQNEKVSEFSGRQFKGKN